MRERKNQTVTVIFDPASVTAEFEVWIRRNYGETVGVKRSVTIMRHSVDWWNAPWLEWESSSAVNVIFLIWLLQLILLIVSEYAPSRTVMALLGIHQSDLPTVRVLLGIHQSDLLTVRVLLGIHQFLPQALAWGLHGNLSLCFMCLTLFNIFWWAGTAQNPWLDQTTTKQKRRGSKCWRHV